MAKNEIKRIGWVGKSVPLGDLNIDGIRHCVFPNRGRKYEWIKPKSDWPPYKVEITVRRVE